MFIHVDGKKGLVRAEVPRQESKEQVREMGPGNLPEE